MTAKVGLDLYRISVPELATTLVIGVSVVNTGKKSLIGLCATTNKEISKYYSQVEGHDFPDKKFHTTRVEQIEVIARERARIVSKFVAKALEVYQKANKNMPDQVFVYRDGVGGPLHNEMLQDIEIDQVIDTIKSYSMNYNPKVLYCLVEKSISTRLFDKDNRGNFINPGPGTCADISIVEKQGENLFEF